MYFWQSNQNEDNLHQTLDLNYFSDGAINDVVPDRGGECDPPATYNEATSYVICQY